MTEKKRRKPGRPRKRKYPRCKPGVKPNRIPFDVASIEELIVRAQGNFAEAARIVEREYEIECTTQRFHYWVERLGAEWYPDGLRKSMAKKCMDTVYSKALEKQDNQCLFKVIDKFGRYVGIEDAAQKVELSEEMRKYQEDAQRLMAEARKAQAEQPKVQSFTITQ